MSGELVIQVIDIGQFRAIRPVLDELDAARALGLETPAVLREAATSPLVRQDRHRGLAALLRRILNHGRLFAHENAAGIDPRLPMALRRLQLAETRRR